MAKVQSEVRSLAGPLVLSNISVAALGMVDSAVMGHLPEPYYLGAVAVGAVIFDFLYWGMGFLRMGTTGVIAQVVGRRDNAALRISLLRGGAIALAIAAIILLLREPVIRVALHLLGGSDAVRAYAATYFLWRVWSAPAALLTLVLVGSLLGMKNVRGTLLVMVSINLINIVLDLLFVFGLGLDVRGVALASVIAEYSGAALAGWLVWRELRRFPGHWDMRKLGDAQGMRGFLSLNGNIFVRTLCLILVFAFFTRQGARQGDLILAANAILLNFQMLLALGLDGFANAAEALVGQAIGARDAAGFRRAVSDATRWSVAVAVAFCVFFVLAGPWLIGVMTDIAGVRETTRQYLPWMYLSPLLSVWCFLLDGVFIGATRGEEMRDTMLLASVAVFIPAWWLLQPLANHGLWLAFMLFFVARGGGLGWHFFRIHGRNGFVPAA